jgi:glycosyltransferase involved in cell wall biosynthesis
LIAKLQRQRPDIVHMQWSRLPIFDRWLLVAARRLDLPVVHTIHDVEPLFNQGWLAGALEYVYSQHVDQFIVHSDENRVRFLKHYPLVLPERVEVIPMLPSVTKLEAGQTRAAARAALGIDPSIFVAMCFGIVKQYKGIDLLLDTIPMVVSRNPKIQFWVVGRSGDEAGEQLLTRLSQFEQVKVTSEYVPSDQLWKFHMAADVMLFPYRQISQSAALATALSYGCAVIVTNVGGLPSLVQGNGWIIPTEQPQAIAEVVLEASQQPEKLAMMRERSKAIVAETLSPHVIARKHIDLYERVIARRERR